MVYAMVYVESFKSNIFSLHVNRIFFRDNYGDALTIVYNAVYRLKSPSMGSETITGCFRYMYRWVHEQKKSQGWRRLASTYIPSPITHYSLLRTVYVSRDAPTALGRRCTIASCAAWPVIFISADPTGPAPECRPTLCGPATRRSRLDATRCLRLDTGAHLCTTMLLPRSVACLVEGRKRAACAMSPVALTTASQAIVLFRSHTSPFLFHGPPRVALTLSVSPARIREYDRARGPFRCPLKSDSFLDHARDALDWSR